MSTLVYQTETITPGERIEAALKPIYTDQKSFYGTAFTITETNDKGTYYTLFSYDTFIVELKSVNNKAPFINAITRDLEDISATTMKHVNEFLRQYNHDPLSKKEFIEVMESLPEYDY